MAQLVKEFRGIPLEAAESSILALAEARRSDDRFVGEGWTITLEELDPVIMGSLTLGRVMFVLEGSEESVERIWQALSPAFLRGGG